jgi:hypothetical protein
VVSSRQVPASVLKPHMPPDYHRQPYDTAVVPGDGGSSDWTKRAAEGSEARKHMTWFTTSLCNYLYASTPYMHLARHFEGESHLSANMQLLGTTRMNQGRSRVEAQLGNARMTEVSVVICNLQQACSRCKHRCTNCKSTMALSSPRATTSQAGQCS